MRIQAIASGSNGNCFYVEEGETRLLVDAGISLRRIERALQDLGTSLEALTAVLLTHDHGDHTAAVGDLVKKYSVPVFCTEKTAENTRFRNGDHLVFSEFFRPVKAGIPFQTGTFSVRPVRTHHDTADPVFYRIDSETRSFALVTDTGYVDRNMEEALRDLDALLIESNYDEHMLEVGPYPFQLKRRVLGNEGHLSNDAALETLSRILTPRMKVVLFGHISEENNYPELIRAGIDAFFATFPKDKKSSGLTTFVATRTESTPVFEF